VDRGASSRTVARLGAAVLAAAAAGCASAGAGGPPPDPRTVVPPGVKQEWLHFADSRVEPGALAPDFVLPTAEGGTMLPLSTFRGRPLVVIFGSVT
jgi:hypothetical protein